MNRHEILAKISHYEWMIESLKISPVHKAWIEDKIEDLTASLEEFYTPAKSCQVITETIKSWEGK